MLLQGNPAVDKIYAYDGRYSSKTDLLRWLIVLLRRRVDLCVSFGNRAPYRRFTRLSRARSKVGRDDQFPSRVYDLVDPCPPGRDSVHEVVRGLRLVSLVAPVPEIPLPVLILSAQERAWGTESFRMAKSASEKVICIHPGAGADYKRWSVEKYGDLARRLSSLSGIRVVILAGPDEGNLAEAVLANANSSITTRHPGSARELAALLSAADILVCNDSGPMHIASALGIPLVAVFGGTDYRRWRPVSARATVVRNVLPCYPCAASTCPHGWACLHGISVDQVWQAIDQGLPGGVNGH
jgi:ADP-heptose:LPS heptosyltransferase